MPASPLFNETSNDLELMSRIREGDASALESLYDRHSSAVLGLCTRILGDRFDAEETLVDVFHQVWRSADRFDASRAQPHAYLLMVARSRSIDQLRSRQRRSRLVVITRDADGLDAFPATPVEPGSPLFSTLAAELRRQIQHALARLNSEQRRAVELSFFLGLTHGEIAERLGTPLGTVKTRIRQGLIRLRDSLRSDLDEEEAG